jgi:hypothetical protein
MTLEQQQPLPVATEFGEPRFESVRRNFRSQSGLVRFLHHGREGELVHFKRVNDVNGLRREAGELRRAADATAGIERIGTATLLGFDPDRLLLLTEVVTHTSDLFDLAWNDSSRWRMRRRPPLTLGDAGLAVGRWYKTYHDSSSDTRATQSDVIRVADVCSNRMKAIHRKWPAWMNNQLVGHVDTWCRRLADERSILEGARRCTIHGDPNLSNLLVTSDGTLVVIDFGDARLGISLEDIAVVWQAIWSIGQCHRQSAASLQGFLSQMTCGYDMALDELLLFQLLRVEAALRLVQGTLTLTSCGLSRYASAGRAYRAMAAASLRWLETESVKWATG